MSTTEVISVPRRGHFVDGQFRKLVRKDGSEFVNILIRTDADGDYPPFQLSTKVGSAVYEALKDLQPGAEISVQVAAPQRAKISERTGNPYTPGYFPVAVEVYEA